MRHTRQEKRIRQGISSGELTRTEAGKLKALPTYVPKLEQEAERDGRITRRERAWIRAAQDATSRTIFK